MAFFKLGNPGGVVVDESREAFFKLGNRGGVAFFTLGKLGGAAFFTLGRPGGVVVDEPSRHAVSRERESDHGYDNHERPDHRHEGADERECAEKPGPIVKQESEITFEGQAASHGSGAAPISSACSIVSSSSV